MLQVLCVWSANDLRSGTFTLAFAVPTATIIAFNNDCFAGWISLWRYSNRHAAELCEPLRAPLKKVLCCSPCQTDATFDNRVQGVVDSFTYTANCQQPYPYTGCFGPDICQDYVPGMGCGFLKPAFYTRSANIYVNATITRHEAINHGPNVRHHY